MPLIASAIGFRQNDTTRVSMRFDGITHAYNNAKCPNPPAPPPPRLLAPPNNADFRYLQTSSRSSFLRCSGLTWAQLYSSYYHKVLFLVRRAPGVHYRTCFFFTGSDACWSPCCLVVGQAVLLKRKIPPGVLWVVSGTDSRGYGRFLIEVKFGDLAFLP